MEKKAPHVHHRPKEKKAVQQEQEHRHEAMLPDIRKRFIISTALTVPVLLLSEMIQHFFNFQFTFPGREYVLFTLSTVIFFYGGWPFLKGFAQELKKKNPGMMTLIAIAIAVSYLYSTAVVFGLRGMDFFWELVTLIDIMLLGHWMEMKSVAGASRSLQMLVKLLPSAAHKLQDGKAIKDVQVGDLKEGDMVLVKPGEKIPADGKVTDGESYVDESMLTGESKPVKKEKNAKVTGGSVNGNGSLKVKVLQTGKNSYLNKVISLVEEAQRSKSKMQNLSDKAARWLTIIAITSGLATLGAWILAGKEFSFSLERMVTVMIISCPHALGLAVPLVVAISTASSAQKGLLIRNRTAFEESRKITTIIFDKTGTLTKGNFAVVWYESLTGEFPLDQILQFAAALEVHSEHPVAAGILDKAKELEIEIPQAEKFNAISGEGIEGWIGKTNVKVVSPGYLDAKGISLPEKVNTEKAETVVVVVIDDNPAGLIALADEIRPESYDAIKKFRGQNIKVMMATGDNRAVAESVSRKLGLDAFYAQVLPHQKAEIIKDLQAKGEFVAMTGDGVNDAPALAQADVGIAVGSGTDIAAETSDILLVESNPQDILELVLFGKATYKKMIQNIAWATGYNLVAIPLAAGVLYNRGVTLSPAAGAVLMSLSTIVVALNAQLLKRSLKIKKAKKAGS